MNATQLFAVCTTGLALVVAAGPLEMPEVFRDAATSPGGVMSFVTALEDEAFRTGNRTEVEAQRWNVQGMIFQIDRFRDKDLLLADVAKWLLPSAERGRPGADKGVNAAANRAFAFIDDGPLRTWNWEGQFEDISPAESRYQNLTKHNACDTAIYMLKRFPGDRKRLAQAREIVRYAEDQFVVWRQPCRADEWALGLLAHSEPSAGQ